MKYFRRLGFRPIRARWLKPHDARPSDDQVIALWKRAREIAADIDGGTARLQGLVKEDLRGRGSSSGAATRTSSSGSSRSWVRSPVSTDAMPPCAEAAPPGSATGTVSVPTFPPLGPPHRAEVLRGRKRH